MYRKFTVLLALLLVLSLTSWAAESEPSNTVGFISFTAAHGSWRPFAFPFTYYDANHNVTTSISNIIVGNLFQGNIATADLIYDQNNGHFCYKTPTGTWTGSLTDIVPGHAYYAYVLNAHPDVSIITAGEVDMTTVNLGSMAANSWTPVGIRDPGTVTMANSCLIQSGFMGGSLVTSDWIYEQNSGHYAWYSTSLNSWQGQLTQLTPGNAYYVRVAPGHSGFTWNYTPSGQQIIDFVFQPIATPIQPPANDKVLQKVESRPVSNSGSNK